ncbi:Integral membrane channel protein [Geosmithia morbida]|uniref:Integral membrane channel protein n=1 Tax=Geosmithia morbida TaxID=1094350 RepID=A0A9P4Z3E8_9HYPO|nr:Integral membrane channel protein [Geosmithia morbida]KAF4126791.1 Integral membrane channel protein [Geosmithia morbida]
MFSSLMRPQQSPRRALRDQLYGSPRRHATADFTTEADKDDDDDDDDDDEEANRHFRRPFTRFRGRAQDRDNDNDNDNNDDDDGDNEDDDQGRGHQEQHDRRSKLPILPLFSTSHLDSIPIYRVTHAIRIIVCARTETTLTWEQLRSPQISQFLVKPMQRQIRTQHFSRGTLYALLANCLQFSKEGQRYAANAGISNTRAKVCELLALKMLKEYSLRELIDALAYDFYPLEGLPGVTAATVTAAAATAGAGNSSLTNNTSNGGAGAGGTGRTSKAAAAAALSGSRTSTLEVAIRASAKHFLAHPVVVQQLEAIWNGAITFYSAADSLHRKPARNESGTSGNPGGGSSSGSIKPDARTPLLGGASARKGSSASALADVPAGRRTVMLYDPKQASMFKLSRLRVPRYRSFLSTLSLAILIGLFLAVLTRRSTQITGLELTFWFWSAGFMLDELVGFNEQGFALYIMSVWNLFDLGILVLLIAYYCMRVYGVFMVDPHHWNDMAYDVLAANAILLLPRIFSILDHYQYFSQLLIAFRLMVVDLVAVFTLVLIMCSGFYVFFTYSNSNTTGGADIAYQIFQLLMGFTPAAWDAWPAYNWLGRALLVLFLFICHFLIVTILITVLTNSFMAIALNANEEHQFLFAINTISMVKNDALFSYIAPSNIFAWLLMPLRYFMPLSQFVLLNRTIIKITHFPVLFGIYAYERLWLAPSMFEPTDLVDNPGHGWERTLRFTDPTHRSVMFSPNIRGGEESVAGFHKDRALEEVFRRMPGPATFQTQRRNERHNAQTAIRNWMDQHESDAGSGANWPTLDSRTPGWPRRLSVAWDRPSNLRHVSDVRSAASDPADLMSNVGGLSSPKKRSMVLKGLEEDIAPDQTDADGDDELVTNDEEEDEDDNATNAGRGRPAAAAELHEEDDEESDDEEDEDYFTTPMTTRVGKHSSSPSDASRAMPTTPRPMPVKRQGMHYRTLSTNTILYNPKNMSQSSKRSSRPSSSPPSPGKAVAPPPPNGGSRPSGRGSGEKTPGRRSSPRRPGDKTPGRRTSPRRPGDKTPGRRASPRRTGDNVAAAAAGARLTGAVSVGPRAIPEVGGGGVSRTALRSIESLKRPKSARRSASSVDLGMLSDNTSLRLGGAHDDHNGPLAGSFQTQMAMAMMKDNHRRGAGRVDAADRDRMGRLVLARMKTLEESFGDMMREMREMKERSSRPTSRWNSSDDHPGAGGGSGSALPPPKLQPPPPPPRKAKANAGESTPRKIPAGPETKRPASSRKSIRETKDIKGKAKATSTSSQWTDDDSESNKESVTKGSE